MIATGNDRGSRVFTHYFRWTLGSNYADMYGKYKVSITHILLQYHTVDGYHIKFEKSILFLEMSSSKIFYPTKPMILVQDQQRKFWISKKECYSCQSRLNPVMYFRQVLRTKSASCNGLDGSLASALFLFILVFIMVITYPEHHDYYHTDIYLNFGL